MPLLKMSRSRLWPAPLQVSPADFLVRPAPIIINPVKGMPVIVYTPLSNVLIHYKKATLLSYSTTSGNATVQLTGNEGPEIVEITNVYESLDAFSSCLPETLPDSTNLDSLSSASLLEPGEYDNVGQTVDGFISSDDCGATTNGPLRQSIHSTSPAITGEGDVIRESDKDRMLSHGSSAPELINFEMENSDSVCSPASTTDQYTSPDIAVRQPACVTSPPVAVHEDVNAVPIITHEPDAFVYFSGLTKMQLLRARSISRKTAPKVIKTKLIVNL